MTERTLILIKSDGVSRGLASEVISRIEHRGLKLVVLGLRVADETTAKERYTEHVNKPFFGELVDSITSAPLVVGVIGGPNTTAVQYQLAGGTSPVEAAAPGSIRGDFAPEIANNVVHGSDSPGPAEHEIGIWFPDP